MSNQPVPTHVTVTNHLPTPQTTTPPYITVSAFIGAAQGKLSLGLTKTVPGMQTLNDAIKQGPSSKVPASILSALQAYMKTKECATAIASARTIAEYTIAKINGSAAPAPNLHAQVPMMALAAAATAAAGQVPKQRNVSAHDHASAVNATLSAFAPEIGGPLEIINQLAYALWGDEGSAFFFGPSLPDLPSDSNGGGGMSYFTQTIYDSVTTFMNSSGNGLTNQTPWGSDQGVTTEHKGN